MRSGGDRAPLVLLETLVLLSIIGTFSGPWLLCRINLSVDSTSNNTEDHGAGHGACQRDRFTSLAGPEATATHLKFATSKCV